ncbi:hypothetical protein LT493_29125 [Streptomyces tricolor]|nr:hypothetical protein [Streptomyces tricolor]
MRVFYEDLSAYTYQDEDTFEDRESFRALWYRPEYVRLNVGWLEAGRPYATGPVPAGFVERLRAVQQVQRMNICLGVHACDLCPEAAAPEGNGGDTDPGRGRHRLRRPPPDHALRHRPRLPAASGLHRRRARRRSRRVGGRPVARRALPLGPGGRRTPAGVGTGDLRPRQPRAPLTTRSPGE